MTRGIVAVGAYAPRNRIPAEAFEEAWDRFDAPGIESKAVLDADEDVVTMGVEAARRALTAGDLDGSAIDGFRFASTNPPLAEEDLTARFGSYLALPAGIPRRVSSGSTRMGLDAVIDALTADGLQLVVASDAPRSAPDDPREHAAGAAAAAVLIGNDAAGTVVDTATYTEPYPGTRFRLHGSTDVDGLDIGQYERSAFTVPVDAAVTALETTEPPEAIALQAPNGKLPYQCDLDTDAIAAVETVSHLGDIGAASALVGLTRAFAGGYSPILAIAWGAGAGASALIVTGNPPVETTLSGRRDVDYTAYLRRRGDIVGAKPDGGAAHVSVPTWRRSLPQRHRLQAGRCPDCETVTFPPAGACGGCRALVDFEPVEPDGTGTIAAVTTIGHGGAPPEFADQQARQGAFRVAIVRFLVDDGAFDVPMQVVGTATVGDQVTAVPRRIYIEEDVPRYGLKVLRSS